MVRVLELLHLSQRALHDQPAKVVDQAQRLGALDKAIGKDQSPLRMLPSRQGFQPRYVSRCNVDLRLVVNYEFIALNGDAKPLVRDRDLGGWAGRDWLLL